MAKFSYAISMGSEDGSSKICWEEQVLSFDKSSEDVLRDGDGLVLTEKVVTRLQKIGSVWLRVTIHKN